MGFAVGGVRDHGYGRDAAVGGSDLSNTTDGRVRSNVSLGSLVPTHPSLPFSPQPASCRCLIARALSADTVRLALAGTSPSCAAALRNFTMAMMTERLARRSWTRMRVRFPGFQRWVVGPSRSTRAIWPAVARESGTGWPPIVGRRSWGLVPSSQATSDSSCRSKASSFAPIFVTPPTRWVPGVCGGRRSSVPMRWSNSREARSSGSSVMRHVAPGRRCDRIRSACLGPGARPEAGPRSGVRRVRRTIVPCTRALAGGLRASSKW